MEIVIKIIATCTLYGLGIVFICGLVMCIVEWVESKSVWLDKIVKDSFLDKSMQGRPLSYFYTGEQFGFYDLNDELPDTRDEHLAIVVMLEDD